MRSLSASDLLWIWERGAGRSPVEQALAILGAVFPQASSGALADLSIALRDAALLRIRELTFGSQLKGVADCPACGERLELTFSAADFPIPDPAGAAETEASVQVEGYEIRFRLPTSADLVAVAGQTEIFAARRALLEACITSVLHGGENVPADALPAEVTNAVAARMEAAGPLANLTLAAACPACSHAWEIVFDIVSYFWSEINAWAIRIMHEVHGLASVYGWREADILTMSAWRRHRYLELIGTR